METLKKESPKEIRVPGRRTRSPFIALVAIIALLAGMVAVFMHLTNKEHKSLTLQHKQDIGSPG